VHFNTSQYEHYITGERQIKPYTVRHLRQLPWLQRNLTDQSPVKLDTLKVWTTKKNQMWLN